MSGGVGGGKEGVGLGCDRQEMRGNVWGASGGKKPQIRNHKFMDSCQAAEMSWISGHVYLPRRLDLQVALRQHKEPTN